MTKKAPLLKDILHIENNMDCEVNKNELFSGFIHKHIKKGEVFHNEKTYFNTFIFCLDGHNQIMCNDTKIELTSGNMLFIPIGTDTHTIAIEDSDIMLMLFEDVINVCDKLFLESYSEIISEEPSTVISSIDMRYPINKMITTMKFCLDRGVTCIKLHEIKHQELFIYLRSFYTKKELASMFYHISGKNYSFRKFILTSWKIDMNTDEIIAKSNMSKSTFLRTFKKVFNSTPLKWKQQQICNKLVQLAIDPTTTIQDLLVDTGISKRDQLNQFCLTHFGCTPTEFIKRYREKIIFHQKLYISNNSKR